MLQEGFMIANFDSNGVMTINGQGPSVDRLIQSGGDIRVLRPWLGNDGKSYVTQSKPIRNSSGGWEMKNFAVPIHNTVATLRHEDWRLIDREVLQALRPRLKFVGALRAAGLEYSLGGNGLAKTVLSHQRQSRMTGAQISMDGLRRGPSDRPVFDMVNTPLPVIHQDFDFPARQILVSRNSGTAIDTSAIAEASELCAEKAEQLALGLLDPYSFGDGTIYGPVNFPQRMVKVLTSPEAGGWGPATLVDEVLDMVQMAINRKAYGPYMLHFGIGWFKALSEDYILTGGNVATQALMERLMKIPGIENIEFLDHLPGYQALLLRKSRSTIEEVVGMEFTTVQWDEEGGFAKRFKILGMMIPRCKADIYGNTGIVHGNSEALEDVE